MTLSRAMAQESWVAVGDRRSVCHTDRQHCRLAGQGRLQPIFAGGVQSRRFVCESVPGGRAYGAMPGGGRAASFSQAHNLDPGWDVCSKIALNPDGHAFPIDLE